MNQAIKWTIIFVCLIAYGLIVAFSGHFWASLLVLFVLLSIGIYDAEIAKWIDKWYKRRQIVRGAISAIIQNFCSKFSGRTVERRMDDLGPRRIRKKGLAHRLRLKSPFADLNAVNSPSRTCHINQSTDTPRRPLTVLVRK